MSNENTNGQAIRRDDDIIAWLYEDAAAAFDVVSARSREVAGLVRTLGRAACLAEGAELDRFAGVTCELRKLAAEAHRAT
jgi:hypothetical protein